MKLLLDRKSFVEMNTPDMPANLQEGPDPMSGLYDNQGENRPSRLIVILCTPRSGSSLLADFLHKNEGCLPLEYIQPFQHLPRLANRWNCLDGDVINLERFAQALIRYRTSQSGTLGITVHGSHLPIWCVLRKYFVNIPTQYIRLTRDDIIAQAVSYAIAKRTKIWLSWHAKFEHPDYSFSLVHDLLLKIQSQNTAVSAYLEMHQSDFSSITYEELSHNPLDTLNSIPNIGLEAGQFRDTELQKQATSLNSDWAIRFSRDLVDCYRPDYIS